MENTIAIVKLHMKAGQATPAPPVGPSLSPHKINIPNFCKEYNAATAKYEKGSIVPVEIFVFAKGKYTFKIKTPPASRLLLKYANISKGSGNPSRSKIGNIALENIIEIAKIKMEDLNTDKLDSAISIIKGTAHSMGLTVVEGDTK